MFTVPDTVQPETHSVSEILKANGDLATVLCDCNFISRQMVETVTNLAGEITLKFAGRQTKR